MKPSMYPFGCSMVQCYHKVKKVDVVTAHNRAIGAENNLYLMRSGLKTGAHDIVDGRIDIPTERVMNNRFVYGYVSIQFDWRNNVKYVKREY